jgi:hypothetical protein
LEENEITTDYLIIGTGIMGLALAQEIRKSEPTSSISIIELEMLSSAPFEGGDTFPQEPHRPSYKIFLSRGGKRPPEKFPIGKALAQKMNASRDFRPSFFRIDSED